MPYLLSPNTRLKGLFPSSGYLNWCNFLTLNRTDRTCVCNPVSLQFLKWRCNFIIRICTHWHKLLILFDARHEFEFDFCPWTQFYSQYFPYLNMWVWGLNLTANWMRSQDIHQTEPFPCTSSMAHKSSVSSVLEMWYLMLEWISVEGITPPRPNSPM